MTIDSLAFQEILNTLAEIKKGISCNSKSNPFSDQWLDTQEVCMLLKISKRTLQYYRTNGTVPYSQIGSKFYYKVSDLEELLKGHYVNVLVKHFK